MPAESLSWPRRLLLRFGLKPYLRSCPPGAHLWRAIYGDEINAHRDGSRWRCVRCPKTHPNPVAEPPPRSTGRWTDPTQDRINEYRRRIGDR